MSNKDRKQLIAMYEKDMRKLMHEFMQTQDFESANSKLNECKALGIMIAELKDEIKENSFRTKFKKRFGL